MASEIVSFSPKIEIINHFDELINRVDIEFDECLQKFNEQQVLGDLKCFDSKKRNIKEETFIDRIIFEYNSDKKQTENLWSKSTKVVDYLNQVRMKTIEELKKGQEDTLEYYKLNSSLLKSSEEITDENKIEELRRDINLKILKANSILNEKMLLICLLERHFLRNLTCQKYPNHGIFVSKRDILNIKKMNIPRFMKCVKLTCSSIDLSKLEELFKYDLREELIVDKEFLDEVDLNGLSSITYLCFYIKSPERFSARNLTSLKELRLIFRGLMDERNSTRIFGHLSNINSLDLKGCFSNINLDSLVNLDKLSLSGEINDDFNYDLLKNLSYHLQELKIYLKFDNDQISKLFDEHIFPYVKKLIIHSSKVTKLEKKMFEGFPMLQTLHIAYNDELQSIDNDAFSSLSNLVHLKLNNNRIEKIDRTHFSSLICLETLKLKDNKIESLDENVFSDLNNLRELDLSYNRLSTLNPQSFFGLGNLEKLNLSGNKLTDFDMRILGYIGKIERINLQFTYIRNKDEFRKRFKDLNICVDI